MRIRTRTAVSALVFAALGASPTGAAADPPTFADLSVTVTAPSTMTVGAAPTPMTVTVHNNGPDAAANARVKVTLPTSLTLGTVSPPGQSTYTGGIWTIGSIPAGADAATLTLPLSALRGKSGDAVVNAVVHDTDAGGDSPVASTGDTDLLNNFGGASITLAPVDADLGISETTTAPTPTKVDEGGILFKVTVTNNAPPAQTGDDASVGGIVVAAPVPDGFALAGGPPAGYDAATGLWRPSGSLWPGEHASMTLTTTATQVGTPTYRAMIVGLPSDVHDPTPYDMVSGPLGVEPLIGQAVLGLTATANDATRVIGDPVSFIITLANTGDTAHGVVIAAPVPSGVVFGTAADSGSPSDAGYSPQTGQWTVSGNLASGAHRTLTISGTAIGAGTATLKPKVVATASDVADASTASVTPATVTITAPPPPPTQTTTVTTTGPAPPAATKTVAAPAPKPVPLAKLVSLSLGVNQAVVRPKNRHLVVSGDVASGRTLELGCAGQKVRVIFLYKGKFATAKTSALTSGCHWSVTLRPAIPRNYSVSVVAQLSIGNMTLKSPTKTVKLRTR